MEEKNLFEDLKQTYNQIAQDWFKDHKEDDWWTDANDLFLSYLKKGDLVLDIGCGAGLKSKFIIDKGFKVVGIDFSEEMIKLAKKYEPRAKFYVKDINEPLNLDLKFDGIFCQAVLLHIPKTKAEQVLKNLVAVLKSGGYLFLGVKGLRTGQEQEQTVTENDYGYEYKRFFSFYTMSEIKGYLSNLAMDTVHETVITRGDTDWVVVIAKMR